MPGCLPTALDPAEMFLDANSLPSGLLQADVCIVGAGPAGLTLAAELADTGWKILLLEHGGLDFEPARQSLLEGRDVTGEYHDPAMSRRSQFGGTAQIWNTPVRGRPGAKHVPLDEIDFEKRDWVPHSGWPFSRATLEPWYARAGERCGLTSSEYQAAAWEGDDARPLRFDGPDVRSEVYQLGTDEPFTSGARAWIGKSDNVDCVLHATVLEITPAPGATRIESVTFQSPARRRHEVRATVFVLSAGGLETPRLLLASRSRWSAGIGNAHDLVGRFLMDHPVYFFTELVPATPALARSLAFYDARETRGATVLGRMTLPPEVLRREKLLNFSAVFYPRPPGYRSPGIEALRQMRLLARKKQFGAALGFAPQLVLHAADVVAYARRRKKHAHATSAHFWSRDAGAAEQFATFEPEFYLEQPPDPENRVSLSAETDEHGLPKTLLNWHWGRASRESAERAATLLDESFARYGHGRLRPLKYPRVNPSGHHHLGTTRMHESPAHGVVDADGRVHETDNLFVAGSAVFPTGGYANPTLTIIALAMRLADHLQTKLRFSRVES